MVWEHKIVVVIMATGLFELGKPKCERYVPDAGETMTFAGITLTLKSQQQAKGYLKNFVSLVKDGRHIAINAVMP